MNTLFFLDLFLIMCVGIFFCICSYVEVPEAVDPLKLEFWLIMSCLMGVLGTELGSTGKAVNPFNPESSLQPQLHSVRDL